MTELTTRIEELRPDKYRETRIEYTESFGESYMSIGVESNLAFDELVAIVRELRGEGGRE